MQFYPDHRLDLFIVLANGDRKCTGSGQWRLVGSRLYMLDTTCGCTFYELFNWYFIDDSRRHVVSISDDELVMMEEDRKVRWHAEKEG